MSEMTKNGTSDDTLIRDSQLTGFHLFKERIGSCCCRLFKKSSNYNLSSVSKDIQQQEDKPSYINQAFQKDKKQRKDKLDQIAKSLPTTINQSSSSNRIVKTQLTPSSNLFQPKTPLSTINNRKIQEEISTGLIFVFILINLEFILI